MQADTRGLRTVKIERLDGFFNVGPQLVPRVALGKDAFGQTLCTKAAVRFLRDLEHDSFTPMNLSDPMALSKWRLLHCLLRRNQDLKQLVEDIAKALVDAPYEVKVHEVEGEQVTVLELRVAAGDLGKIIGKQGRTARSIRTLLGAAGMKLNRRFTLEILE